MSTRMWHRRHRERKKKEKENEKEKEKENKREKERERERATERKREQKAGRDRRIEVKAYYTARRAPGIPDFQVRSQVSRGARSAADHFDLRPHQSSPNHTPLISARHESRRTFSRNGQGRAYSLPPSSCSPLPPLSSLPPAPHPLYVSSDVFRTPTISLDREDECLRRLSKERLILSFLPASRAARLQESRFACENEDELDADVRLLVCVCVCVSVVYEFLTFPF